VPVPRVTSPAGHRPHVSPVCATRELDDTMGKNDYLYTKCSCDERHCG
jgi:hypothetical protein